MTTITLPDYIKTVMNEAGFNEPIGDVQRYVRNKAKEALKGQNGAIDNETVRGWILDCRNGVHGEKTEKKQTTFNKEAEINKAMENAGKPNDKKMGQDAYMESLF